MRISINFNYLRNMPQPINYHYGAKYIDNNLTFNTITDSYAPPFCSKPTNNHYEG